MTDCQSLSHAPLGREVFMDPLELMSAEHDAIKCVVSACEAMGRTARAEGLIASSVVDDFVRFFRGFADQIHHGKEEHVLFEQLKPADPSSSINGHPPIRA